VKVANVELWHVAAFRLLQIRVLDAGATPASRSLTACSPTATNGSNGLMGAHGRQMRQARRFVHRTYSHARGVQQTFLRATLKS
jgi:hypothetical protein